MGTNGTPLSKPCWVPNGITKFKPPGKTKSVDNIIIDTAGRLHTQTNLAKELQKMVRTANKAMEGAPHRKILILDGTQGSSSINQAKKFNEIIGVDGIIVHTTA